MTVHRYPPSALIGDYIRTAVGLMIGLGVLGTVPVTPVILVLFGGVSVLFLVFGLRTLKRQMMRVAVTDGEIRSRGLGARILAWSALERMKLRYYGTRRQRHQAGTGFMQLTLVGAGTRLTLDSSIEGFEGIARRAARAARANGLSLDPASAGNLEDLGIATDDGPPLRQAPTGTGPGE